MTSVCCIILILLKHSIAPATEKKSNSISAATGLQVKSEMRFIPKLHTWMEQDFIQVAFLSNATEFTFNVACISVHTGKKWPKLRLQRYFQLQKKDFGKCFKELGNLKGSSTSKAGISALATVKPLAQSLFSFFLTWRWLFSFLFYYKIKTITTLIFYLWFLMSSTFSACTLPFLNGVA